MQLSEKTLTVLKNFAKFNENILIEEGSVLKTMTNQKNVFATATIEEEFPREVPIYNLTEFLNALSLFKAPELEFEDAYIEIKDTSGQGIKYFYADKSVLAYPEKDIAFKKKDLEFKLTAVKLEKVLLAARTLNLPNVTLVNDGEKLFLRAHDAANATSNKFDVTIDDFDVSDVKEFQAHFKMENLRLLELDYDVAVNLQGIASFSNENYNLVYLIGLATAKK
jgi:hypothetical protein